MLARRQVLSSPALEFQTLANETARRLLRSTEPLLSRAVVANVVLPELQVRDLTAATVHPGDPRGLL
ncbi:hypothetical protein [Nonomuraea sp. NPDC050202]|uniref:hypothetical protein n=1 Tax=Nonomuraea sp. NPDC050202 TaxID=3155035 RepID=UPI0033F3C579